MPTAKKAAVIEELADKLGRVNAAALIEYRGLNVAEISDLRNQLRQGDIELQVTKNTLLREAAHRNNMTNLDDLFAGPTAVAFIYGDEAAGTKALNNYFRTARVGEIKSGILKGGRKVSAEQFAKLADLPNRQTLLGQIAGLLESPLAQLASLFNAPAQQLAYAIAALEDKGGAAGAGITADAPPATASASAAPETATPPAPETAAETSEATIPGSTAVAAEKAPPAAAGADDALAAPATGTVETTTAPAAEATPTPQAADEPVAASSDASVAASDVTSAPEEDGGAADAATTTTTTGAEPVSGQEAAADPSSAPESAGSADAQP